MIITTGVSFRDNIEYQPAPMIPRNQYNTGQEKSHSISCSGVDYTFAFPLSGLMVTSRWALLVAYTHFRSLGIGTFTRSYPLSTANIDYTPRGSAQSTGMGKFLKLENHVRGFKSTSFPYRWPSPSIAVINRDVNHTDRSALRTPLIDIKSTFSWTMLSWIVPPSCFPT